MQIRFSIITVSYNSSHTIGRTIESVLAQTYDSFEYIVVDGCSVDNTIEIVRSYEKSFEGKLYYISEQDSGIYNAMNKGIRMATGDIIGIVNSDDWLEKDALQNLLDYMMTSQIDVSSSFILTGAMNFHYKKGGIQLMQATKERFTSYIQKYRMGLNHPATFVSKKVYEEVGLFDEKLKLYADADFIMRCYKSGVPIYFLKNILSNMADGGASNKISKQSLLDRKYILKKYSENRWEYFSFYCQSILLYCIKAILPTSVLKMVRHAKV